MNLDIFEVKEAGHQRPYCDSVRMINAEGVNVLSRRGPHLGTTTGVVERLVMTGGLGWKEKG